MKKFLICTILVLFFSCSFVYAKNNNDQQKPDIKPLKIEQNYKQNYKYGTFDKTFKNSQMDKKDDFSEILDEPQRKEPTILDIFNALVFVILLILVTGWIYMKIKKINPEQLLSGKFSKLTENSFKIISSLQLGGGKAIYLIEINNKQLIIGTTSSSVNLLAQMDKSDKNNEIPQECIEKLFNDKTEEFKKLEE